MLILLGRLQVTWVEWQVTWDGAGMQLWVDVMEGVREWCQVTNKLHEWVST